MAIGETDINACSGMGVTRLPDREFQVGDRVKYISGAYDDTPCNPLWGGNQGKIKGTIKRVDYQLSTLPIKVDWDNGKDNTYDKKDLQLIKDPKCEEKQTPHEGKIKRSMTKLNSMMKRLLDADTQKLVKASFIDGDLELTERGRINLMTILFSAHKEELVKLAEEVIKEEKED